MSGKINPAEATAIIDKAMRDIESATIRKGDRAVLYTSHCAELLNSKVLQIGRTARKGAGGATIPLALLAQLVQAMLLKECDQAAITMASYADCGEAVSAARFVRWMTEEVKAPEYAEVWKEHVGRMQRLLQEFAAHNSDEDDA